MEYASYALDPHTQRSVNRLEMVHRRAVRLVKGDYDRTYSDTPTETDLKWNISTLQDRRLHSKTLMFYRIVH